MDTKSLRRDSETLLASMNNAEEEKHIVIVGKNGRRNSSSFTTLLTMTGGGVVGCCVAYYISRHPRFHRGFQSIKLIEASKVAGASSGKAGGLVAAWADPWCIAPLSFQLHADLAREHDGESNWGYRTVHCADVDAMGEAVGHADSDLNGSQFHSHSDLNPRSANFPSKLDWIRPGIIESYTELGDPSNTAQVHPYQFTTAIAQLAEAKGVEIIMGTVMQLNYIDKDSAVESLTYKVRDSEQIKTIPVSDVVVATGPWTRSLLPEAPIKESRNHSIVIRPSRPISAYVIFPELHPRIPQKRIPPEIYPRPDGTIYSCGPSDEDVPLPESSGMVNVNQTVCETIYRDISSISQEIHDGEILIQQACYRPIVVGRNREIGPLVGPTNKKGLWLAAGHDSWGIQNGPASGMVMAELIFEKSVRSADVSSLDPRCMLGKV